MTSTIDDVAALHAQVRALTDRAEISELCDRYVMHLDKDRGEDGWLDRIFTPDAHLTFPMGEYEGLAGLTEFQRMARTTFERTHHLSANHVVELDGDRGRVRVHLIAVHLKRTAEPGVQFTIGGHYEAEVVRTARGWRIQAFVFDVVWNDGEGPTPH